MLLTAPDRAIETHLRLTPGGSLRLEAAGEASTLARAFASDWREGWFRLAADKPSVTEPTLRYWRDLAARYLTRLCHIPPGAERLEVETLMPAERDQLVLSAPPMEGGEYLSSELLQGIWEALDGWVRERAEGRLSAFLEEWAPKWHQVGRVCFHLAENRQDQERPFAFLATYSTGFTAGGRLKHLPLRKALEQYAGNKNRPALIKLLTPVQQAAEALDWVGEMVESKALYKATAWTVEQAYRFLQSAPVLEESGLTVKLPNWWRKRPRPQVSIKIGEQKEGLGAEALLDFQLEVVLGEQALTQAEVRKLLRGQDGLVLVKGQWVEVDRERLRQALDHWRALERRGEVSFVEGMRLLAGAPADLKGLAEEEEEREWMRVEAGRALSEILHGLRQPAALTSASPGRELRATLRPYQQTGLNWLRFLTRLGLGACLADDMGLGKTVQVLALLLGRKRELDDGPSLLVVPASLLGNWKAEAERFAPSLKLVFAHPSELGREAMEELPDALSEVDLVVTTYSMVYRLEWFTQKPWSLVILDEAQAIKNPSARQTRAVKKLPARARVALTGTPVENRLGDLWSLFDFLNPGLLGSANVFKTFIKGLQSRTEGQFAPLRSLVAPYILRRLKTDPNVVSDLPEKVELTDYCLLTKQQARLYQKTLEKMKESLEKSDGMARRGVVLQSLMRLKQVCNHPAQLTGEGDFEAGKSGKFERLGEICSEIASRQEKVLVFTQFREIIDPLAEFLARVFGRGGLVLHGATAVGKRQELVRSFQDEEGPPFFVLSLKAGGTGLTLTGASHVVHFDRWWNPAVENQATDRAFRIGQTKNVMVHKFVTRGTLEERIDALIASKKALADEILSGEGEVNLTELSDAELLELVSLDVKKAGA